MTQIFISYSRNDRLIAETIRNFLDVNFKTWIDLEGIPGGELWEQEILMAISASYAMVVFGNKFVCRVELGRKRDCFRA